MARPDIRKIFGVAPEAPAEVIFRRREFDDTRRVIIVVTAATAVGLAGAACGVRGTREIPKTPTPQAGTIKNEKVGAWDSTIEAYIEKNPQSKKQIKGDWEDGREFFAVEARHDRRPPSEMRAAVVLPLSADLPKPSNGYDSIVYYAVGRKDGSVTPFPERSGISSLKFTPSTVLGREVLGEADEALVNRNVTVVQARVLGPGVQGKPEPSLATVLLGGNLPARTDAFLQSVRRRFLDRRPPLLLEVTGDAPLVLQHFPAKVIEKDGKLVYTRSDPIQPPKSF